MLPLVVHMTPIQTQTQTRKASFRLLIQKLSHALLRLMVVGVGIVVFGLVLAFLSAGEIYDYQDTVARGDLPVVDAVVCLAGGRGRISLAGDIWYQYWEMTQDAHSKVLEPPVLYLAGMGPQANWALLVKQFRPEVIKVLRPENVVIEKESSNTATNALWLTRYAREKHWTRVLLLTSTYHMKRAQLIFERALRASGDSSDHGSGPAIELETISAYQDPFSRSHWKTEPVGIRVTFSEYLKWLYYRYFWNG